MMPCMHLNQKKDMGEGNNAEADEERKAAHRSECARAARPVDRLTTMLLISRSNMYLGYQR